MRLMPSTRSAQVRIALLAGLHRRPLVPPCESMPDLSMPDLEPLNAFAHPSERRRVLLDHAEAYQAAGMPRSAALALALATGTDAVRELVRQPDWWHPEDDVAVLAA